MSVLVVGMSHRSAPVALLERLSMDDSMQTEATRALTDQASLSEAMIVSTCNRLEVYAVSNAFHTGVNDVLAVLEQYSGVSAAELRGYLYVRYADAAVKHLMTVTSGLDSMVVGEQQIIGQVREAYQEAAELGTVGPALHALAQTALHTGKRVHSETAVDDAGASMVTFALDEAMHRMGITQADAPDALAGRSALVLGAGAMSSLAATNLGKRGIDRLIIANRTRSRAERLAEHAREAGVAAEVVDFSARAGALSRVDLAVSATASDGFTITADDISGPAVLVDLSLPRDVDDAVADLPGVTLINIEALHSLAAADGAGATDDSVTRAKEIVDEEVETFTSELRRRDIAPVVTQLRVNAAETASAELDKLRAKLPELRDDEFEEVSRAVRRIVDKLLHHPTVKIKELAMSQNKVSYESAIEELFGLTGGADTRTGFSAGLGKSYEMGSLAGFCEGDKTS